MATSKHRERPALTVDIVVLALVDARLKVLLVKRRNPPFEGRWAIPGGFVEPGEPLEDAARRELREETGAKPGDLEQLHTFGDPGRDPRGWTISVVYVGWLGSDAAQGHCLQAGSDAQALAWFDAVDLPSLAFDHADILTHALRTVHQRATLDKVQ